MVDEEKTHIFAVQKMPIEHHRIHFSIMKPIDNIISQVIESDHSEWHWITALNYERLGYSDDMIGCLEVVSIFSEQPEKRIVGVSAVREESSFF